MNTTERQPTIITAGNGRRQKTVELTLQQPVQVSHFDDRCEDPLSDVRVIAGVKTLLAAENWFSQHETSSSTLNTPDSTPTYLLGADIMPYIAVPQEAVTVALKKPPEGEIASAIAANFQRLLESKNDTEPHCVYRLRSSTSVNQVIGQEVAWQQHYGLESQVALDADQVAYYATAEGVQEYQAAFEAFNEHFPIHKVAGGFCVEVLIAQGAVRELDGVDLYTADPADVYEAIHGTIYTAVSTVSPEALAYLANRTQPNQDHTADVHERAWNLPFVTELAHKAFIAFWRHRESQQHLQAVTALALADQWQMPAFR